MSFSEEQILSMAPDDSSKKSGKELANSSKWVKLEQSDRAAWGECKGSGKLPYQTQVDLKNIAFKCTCPSRKFPCKHGLGLLLIYGRDNKSFKQNSEPDWVINWLDKRNEKAEKKEEKKVKQEADPVAQAKRQENRLKRVSDGADELMLWIKDIVRNGLLTIPSKDPSYFENMAKRMVDAQAPGLANMVRELGNINFFREGWQTEFLDQLVRIYLVISGLARMDYLPNELQEEIKNELGFTQNQDSLKAEQGIRDQWIVLAKQVTKEDNLTTERNWLYGTASNRFALVLQFYVRSQIPEVNLLPGSTIDAELVFFKGLNPLRALVKVQYGITQGHLVKGHLTFRELAESVSKQISITPFIDSIPIIIEDVELVASEKQWLLKDSHGSTVNIDPSFKGLWKLLALSGGHKMKLFALGNENNYEPIGVWIDQQYKMLA